MTEKAVLIQAGNQMQEEYLKNWDENKVYDEAVKEEIEKRFSFAYPYKYLEDIPVKVSVSDLKREAGMMKVNWKRISVCLPKSRKKNRKRRFQHLWQRSRKSIRGLPEVLLTTE